MKNKINKVSPIIMALALIVEKMKHLPKCNFIIVYTRDINSMSVDEVENTSKNLSLLVSSLCGRGIMCVLKEPDDTHDDGDVLFFENPHMSEYSWDNK